MKVLDKQVVAPWPEHHSVRFQRGVHVTGGPVRLSRKAAAGRGRQRVPHAPVDLVSLAVARALLQRPMLRLRQLGLGGY